MNIDMHKSNLVTTYQGRAALFVQSEKQAGEIKISAGRENLKSNTIVVVSK